MNWLNAADSFIWGPPLLVLLVGTGILLTLRLKMLQVFKLPKALKLIFRHQNAGSGDIDSFQGSLHSSSATVGTGNIVGVATAIAAGGPGLFLDVDGCFLRNGNQVCGRSSGC